MSEACTALKSDTSAFARTAVNIDTAGLGAKPQFANDDFFPEVGSMMADLPVVFVPLTQQKLQADAIHIGKRNGRGPTTHIRLNILPDGGISRLRRPRRFAE